MILPATGSLPRIMRYACTMLAMIRSLAFSSAALLLAAASIPCRAQTADDIAVIQARALELVNQSREEDGLSPLALEDKLTAAAQAHADDMLTRHYYGHASPEGGTAADRYVAAGGSRWRLIAENIAQCSGCRPPVRVGVLRRLHASWLESPGHRRNILREDITHFGFGMVVDEERQLYAVQTFAGPGRPRRLEADEAQARLSAEEQARQVLRRFNQAREQSGGAPLAFSPALTDAAQTILPDQGLEQFDLASRKNLLDVLPPAERDHWHLITVFSADCGACGTTPTAADVRFFAQQWLDDPSYRQAVLDPSMTHVGFAIATNGQGMKVGLAVLARED
jgi:uncharacterized protein YkwD